MKRLLMISYPFPPNASAGAVRSERFARYLEKLGWHIEVVTIKPRKDLSIDSTLVASKKRRRNIHFTSTIDPWIWLRDRRASNPLSRIIRAILMRLTSFPDHMIFWIPFAVIKCLQIGRRQPFDVIYTTSPPHSAQLAGLIISQLKGKPWVADFRDPWTLNLYREKGKIEKCLLNLERLMERKVLKNASVVLANTMSNRKNLLNAFSWLEQSKVLHLPNGWEEFQDDISIENFNRNDGPLTIVHAGTLYPKFKPYALLYALAEWRKQENTEKQGSGDGVRILLVGARDKETRRVIRELELGDVVEIRQWVPLNEARAIMWHADLLWASLGTGSESSNYVPSKIFEYAAAKRPVIGFFPKGEAETLIRQLGIGIVFTEDDPRPVIGLLKDLTRNRKAAIARIYKPDPNIFQYYHARSLAERLCEILDGLAAIKK